MEDLTNRQIMKLFEKDYVEKGYIYSGSIPINASWLYHNRGNLDRLLKLVKKGKIVQRECKGCSFELPVERRRELIEKHGLAEKWEKKAPYFYPNGPYGEVTCVFGRTKEVLQRQASFRLHQNTHGYYAYFNSKSGNGQYKTQYWEHDHRQFKRGMITCNCPGWRFRRKCCHQDDMKELLTDAQIISPD